MSHMTIGKVVLGNGSSDLHPRSSGQAMAPAAAPKIPDYRAAFEKFLRDRMQHALGGLLSHQPQMSVEETLAYFVDFGLVAFDMAAKSGPKGVDAVGWCLSCNKPVYPGSVCEQHSRTSF